MSTVTLSLTASTFLSVNPAWTLEQFHQALVSSISASTTSSNVVLGQIGGNAPITNIGPWLNGTTWYAWNAGTSSYVPATIKVGNATNQITLTGTPTANRVIAIPDATGTLALTSDINRVTMYPALAATVNLDWSLSNSFAISLDRNITITNSNSLSGQEISIAIYDVATWTVTWPGSVSWSGGTAPTQTTGGKTDIYRLCNIGGNLYGRVVQNY